MCIIVSKERNVALPTKGTLKTCFINNPDGAGFMYVRDGRVVIDKGYMNFKSFYKRLQELKKEFGNELFDKTIVMHFRIGTSGGSDKSVTHPFPLTSDSKELKKIYTFTNVGIVHNGIIHDYVYGKMSDTQNFIKDYLWTFYELNRTFYKHDNVRRLIEKDLGGKLCILDKNEEIYYIGNYIIENGVKYSNDTYYEYYYRYYDTRNYPYNYDDDYLYKEDTKKLIKYDNYDYDRDYELNCCNKGNMTITRLNELGLRYAILEKGDNVEVDNDYLEVTDSLQIILTEGGGVYELEENSVNLNLIGFNSEGVFDMNYKEKEINYVY